MTVLRVGNQMNDGGDKQHGFTLDGLCKLQSAKAFDKKTSVLQYIVMLVRRHDEQALLFPGMLTLTYGTIHYMSPHTCHHTSVTINMPLHMSLHTI